MFGLRWIGGRGDVQPRAHPERAATSTRPAPRCALRLLIPPPSAGFEGQATDIEIHAAEILKTRKKIDEIYAKHTGQTEEQVRHDMERDRFFKPDQAAEYGLIDRVIHEH